ncbi:MAG TPA: hypothetical protein VGH19_15490 [Verrucomicrobiae bacterium]
MKTAKVKVYAVRLAWTLAVLLGLGLLVGVWLPDIIFAPRMTLAKKTLADGTSFKVIQYWNRSDFYSTELHIKRIAGADEMVTLDGDDAKSWWVPLQVDEGARSVTVTLGIGRSSQVNY